MAIAKKSFLASMLSSQRGSRSGAARSLIGLTESVPDLAVDLQEPVVTLGACPDVVKHVYKNIREPYKLVSCCSEIPV